MQEGNKAVPKCDFEYIKPVFFTEKNLRRITTRAWGRARGCRGEGVMKQTTLAMHFEDLYCNLAIDLKIIMIRCDLKTTVKREIHH